ncbi:zinc metallopeptidase [Sphingobacterium sp. UT-1RO-CII-1]|uniref:zinc metallopeptidase n=1 Tax=Sphingobacterium sp. UT-1RO-CII-1 TaxID=2995225 RepID=UPI00227D66B5|nr:zinc metallopeptidase [Sphingobacterium sp. UT-1RO-CII-1]MCY4778148.1 zinc metallopeptidase [Sphingobacterium sp. UT-1RO-CII-1]
MGLYWIIFIGIALISWIVQARFKSKFKKYSEMPLTSGMSGAEVAQKMLHDNGIYDVQIFQANEGQLSDHYNPANRSVNLSAEVYHGRSVAAAAVAAHECGHAVQHATAYSWLQFRSAMVPIVSVASRMTTWVLMIGVVMMFFNNPWVLAVGVGALFLTTLFSFVTLPVEFDASARALAWLNSANITHTTEEHDGAKDALKWAAMTYVVAALSALVTLLYYAYILFGRRD